MEQTTLGVFFPPDCVEQAQRFFERYEMKGIVANGDPAYAKRNLRGYSTRTCRFCGRTYPNAPFSHDSHSHLLPQLIGNSSLYSEYECDDCNQRFSVYEDDLAAYLGISRSIAGYSPEKKTKGFKGRSLSAKSRSYVGDNILILAPEDTTWEQDRLIIRYTKNPFVPNYVYRSLLKSAISLLSDSEANGDYRLALEYLKGKDFIERGAEISGYQLSFGINLPLHVYRFEKKRIEDPIPTHVFAFYFQNRIIVFPVPFHRQDLARFGNGYTVLVPPPCFVSEEDRDNAMPVSFRRDLSSSEKIDIEEETLTMIVDPEVLKNACVYDPATGKIEPKEFSFGNTKYLILVKKGMTVDPAEFSEFIKRTMES
jgi:hypothetical protein